MEPADLLAYWGIEGLRKYAPDLLQGFSMPSQAKEFLVQVGMPIIHDPLFQFEPENAPFPIADQAKGFFTIGIYDISPICLKEGSGELYWYDPDNRSARFMNNGLIQFALVLTLYVKMLIKCRITADNQRRPIVEEAERQMKLVDSKAFASEESYWSIIFEEIGYELD